MPDTTDSDTRQRILRATLHLIGVRGVGTLTESAVATTAGVSLGSVSYHFPNQTLLLREALLMYVDEEVARLIAVAEPLYAGRVSARGVVAEVERLSNSWSGRLEDVAVLELHLQASRDPALQEASLRFFEALEGVATAALAADGVPDPAHHARGIVAMLQGMVLRRLATGEHDAAGTADLLLTMVRGAKASEGRVAGRGELRIVPTDA